MNPWRKHRRQKLRRQNGGTYPERWISADDFIVVNVGPLLGASTARLPDGVPFELFDFTKSMPRMFAVHDPSEFFGLEDLPP